jgi:hypothetical protein
MILDFGLAEVGCVPAIQHCWTSQQRQLVALGVVWSTIFNNSMISELGSSVFGLSWDIPRLMILVSAL